ncbi:hypothetical protein C0993_008062 [Termitomyces sp. T159_Od127]|nr:hypothetical protein C0993_008062 [Termitomyces sp. T159_Od127]
MGGIADHPPHRKRLLLSFALLGATPATTFLILPSTSSAWFLVAPLAILANVGFGASVVAMNAYLPALARESPEVRQILLDIDNDTETAEHADDPDAPLMRRATTEAQAKYEAELSRVTSRISSFGIALGYGAGIFLLLVALVPVTLLHGSTFALRLAIGLSGVWWAAFTIPAAIWLPGGAELSDTPRGQWSTRREIVAAWKRLGDMLRWTEIKKLRNTFKYLAAWFLLSDGESFSFSPLPPNAPAGFTTITSTAILFGKTSLHMAPSALILIGVLTPTSGILGSLAWPAIQRRCNWPTRKVILVLVLMASAIPAYGCLGFLPVFRSGGSARFGGLTTQGEMFVLAVYFGSVYGAFQGYARAFYAELLPPGEEARWYGLFSITDKSSSFLGPLAVGLIADTTGNIRYAFFFLVGMTSAGFPAQAKTRRKRPGLRLSSSPEQPITARELLLSGCIHDVHDGIKILGDGAEHFKTPIYIKASRASKSAIKSIEGNGGKVVCQYYNQLALRDCVKGRTDRTAAAPTRREDIGVRGRPAPAAPWFAAGVALCLHRIEQAAFAGPEVAVFFEDLAFWQAGQDDVADSLLGEEGVDVLVHEHGHTCVACTEFAVVFEHGLQELVDLDCGERQADVERGESAEISDNVEQAASVKRHDLLELFSTEVLDEDLLLGLDLEELEDEAYEGRGALVGVDAADVGDLDGLVDEALGCRGFILVSPHRTRRPWLGQVEAAQPPDLPAHDPACYLCPGNFRAVAQQNPDYRHTFTFPNDFAAVLPPPVPAAPPAPHPLLAAHPVHGACDVLVFHPAHNLALARLRIPDIDRIVAEWIAIYRRRGAQPGIKYVQIFENKGAIMGCSNPHPHGQVWSLSAVPTLPATELASLRRYAASDPPASHAPRAPDGRPCLLCEYAHAEAALPRVVVANDHWLALVPWWATWPFEIMLLPYKRHIPSIAELSPEEQSSLAQILSKVTIRYDNLFSCSFPYSMGIHQRPIPNDQDDVAHLHFHFTPPLLRSATVKKFLVGFELMAEAQRDLTPEQAATRLRECSEKHYLDE